MENKIQIFKNEKFGEVRTINKDGEAWFVGKDVAEVLGYVNTKDALAKHVDAEDKMGSQIATPSRGTQTMTIINESGLYSLILSSKLPQAREFKHWVTSEVLPQIRKTGGYIPVSAEDDEKTLLSKALLICKKTMEQQDGILEAQKPKVQFADAVVATNDSILVRDLAKLITRNGVKMGAGRLFYWLRLHGYLFKNEVMPIQKWVEAGLFETVVTIFEASGKKHERIVARVTGKGQQYFVNGFVDGRFKAENGCWR